MSVISHFPLVILWFNFMLELNYSAICDGILLFGIWREQLRLQCVGMRELHSV